MIRPSSYNTSVRIRGLLENSSPCVVLVRGPFSWRLGRGVGLDHGARFDHGVLLVLGAGLDLWARLGCVPGVRLGSGVGLENGAGLESGVGLENGVDRGANWGDSGSSNDVGLREQRLITRFHNHFTHPQRHVECARVGM